MYSYALLEPGCHDVIQEEAEGPLSLVRIIVETDHCLFVTAYSDGEELIWKRKSDPIHDIIELLSDEHVREWETVFNKDAYNYEEEDEE
jgi:hypothetical protein